MTIEQMRSEIIANVKRVQEIGAQKKRAGTPVEVLKQRCHSFADLLKWYNGSRTVNLRKSEMEFLLNRSRAMVKNFERL